MTTRLLIPLLAALAFAACSRAPENQEAVREGIVEHLSKNTGLDLGSMDMDITNVTFEGNRANATVAFKPKASPDAGMSMNYALERRGAKWVVQTAGGGGHGPGLAGAPSHGATPPPGGADLPPGHPPVQGSGEGQGGSTGGADLPPGHPPVQPAK